MVILVHPNLIATVEVSLENQMEWLSHAQPKSLARPGQPFVNLIVIISQILIAVRKYFRHNKHKLYSSFISSVILEEPKRTKLKRSMKLASAIKEESSGGDALSMFNLKIGF